MEFKPPAVKEAAVRYVVQSPEDVFHFMDEEKKADRECFWVIHLNTTHQIIEKELVSVGILNQTLVHPREVFKKAILNGTAGLITVHNHPSASFLPSAEDKSVWEKLDRAGELIGIKILDHLIITPGNGFYSRKEGRSWKNTRK